MTRLYNIFDTDAPSIKDLASNASYNVGLLRGQFSDPKGDRYSSGILQVCRFADMNASFGDDPITAGGKNYKVPQSVSLRGRGANWDGGLNNAVLLKSMPDWYDRTTISGTGTFYSLKRELDLHSEEVHLMFENNDKNALTLFGFLGTQLGDFSEGVAMMLHLMGVPHQHIPRIQKDILSKLNPFDLAKHVFTPDSKSLESMASSAMAKTVSGV